MQFIVNLAFSAEQQDLYALVSGNRSTVIPSRREARAF